MERIIADLHTHLPRLESAFITALAEIQKSEHLNLRQMLGEIKRQRGRSLPAKARLYALSYYQDVACLPRPEMARQNSPLEIALAHVRGHGKKH